MVEDRTPVVHIETTLRKSLKAQQVLHTHIARLNSEIGAINERIDDGLKKDPEKQVSHLVSRVKELQQDKEDLTEIVRMIGEGEVAARKMNEDV